MGEHTARVALFTPDWPPERFANGIVTYAGLMRGALGALGTETLIVSAGVAPEDRGAGVVDMVDWRRRGAPWRLLDRIHRRLDPAEAALRRARRSLAACLRHVSVSHGLDLFEIEESFGLGSAALGCDGFPTVARLHGPWFLNGRALGAAEDRSFVRRDRREGRFIARAHAVSSPSRDVLDRTRDHFGLELAHAQVIPNPAPDPPAAWDPRRCEPRTILFVGRFDRHKGGDLVIDAFREIAAQAPDARLLFVGPDRGLDNGAGGRVGLEEYVRRQLSDGAVQERVERLGPLGRREIDALRLRASVTVVPSRYEVFAMTALEALASGAPVVAARAGGLAELFEHDRSALLFPPGDAGALAARVLELLASPERAAKLGEGAHRRARTHYAPAVVAGRTRDFYDELLARFRAGERRRT